MGWFDKKAGVQLVAAENEISVPVRDIKEYLVKEYERVKSLELQLEKFEQDKEIHRELKLKYDATLVIVDELDKRIDSKEKRIQELSDKISLKQKSMDELNDDKNSLLIKLNDLGRTKEDIEKSVEQIHIFNLKMKVHEVLDCLLYDIDFKKGNLSKEYMKSCINRYKKEMESL